MEAEFARDEHGGWLRRLVAWLLDSAIFAVSVFTLLVGIAMANDGEIHLEGGAMLLGLVAASLLWELFWVAGPARSKPGHRLAGMRVLGVDGARVPTSRAALRWLVRSLNVPLGGLPALASAFTIAASPRRQAVHDLVAGTVLLRARALEARANRSMGAARDHDQAPSAPHERRSPVTLDDEEPAAPRGPFL